MNGFNYVLHSMFPHQHMDGVAHNISMGQPTQKSNKEKLKDAAKKATDLAKSKAPFPKVENI